MSKVLNLNKKIKLRHDDSGGKSNRIYYEVREIFLMFTTSSFLNTSGKLIKLWSTHAILQI